MALPIANLRRALIIGAGHGLGLALARALRFEAPGAEIFATYRDAARATALRAVDGVKAGPLDPLDETALAEFANALGPLDLVINAIGVLQDEVAAPERALGEVTLARLQHSFAVNAFVTPLLARALKSKIARDNPSAFVALSAKVGSIADNQLGGWYGYRASKTALNMFIKNIAIEFARTGLSRCQVLAIHPGTTETDLSRPFVAHVKHRVWSPAESAAHILDTIATATGTGQFLNWDRTELPW